MSTAVQKSGSLFASISKVEAAAPQTGIEKLEQTSGGSRYVGFYSGKGDKAGEISSALPGIPKGAAFMYDPVGGYQRLDNFRYHPIALHQSWVKRDSTNTPVAATKKRQDFKSELKENIEAVVLVYTNDGKLVPAITTFKSGASSAGAVASAALEEAGDAKKWGAKSPDHAFSAQIPDPRFRFVVAVKSWSKTFASGFLGIMAKGTVKPTSAGEFGVAQAALDAPGFEAELKSAMSAFKYRVDVLEKLCGAKT